MNMQAVASIDMELYGMLVRRARLNLGYRRGDDFVAALQYHTGVSISKDTLYRIETAKQEPSINFILAMNLMEGKGVLDMKLIDMCVPMEWKESADSNMGIGHREDGSVYF